MKFVYTKSAFEMPDGKYLAKFLGCTLREPQPGEQPKLGMDGKPMPPAMTWDFEIIEGPTEKPDIANRGKKADKLTGRVPTPKSGCGKMLAAIADTILRDGIEVDIAHYVGKTYRITIIDNRVTDNPGPVRVHENPPAEIADNGAPIINRAASHAGLDPNARWDIHDGQNSLKDQTTAQVQAMLAAGAPAAMLRVKPAGAAPSTAKTAGQWGFIGSEVKTLEEIPW